MKRDGLGDLWKRRGSEGRRESGNERDGTFASPRARIKKGKKPSGAARRGKKGRTARGTGRHFASQSKSGHYHPRVQKWGKGGKDWWDEGGNNESFSE